MLLPHRRIARLRWRLDKSKVLTAALAGAEGRDRSMIERKLTLVLGDVWDDIVHLEAIGALEQMQSIFAAEAKAHAERLRA